MKNMKKALCILTLALFSLALLTGCGSSGKKLSDTDEIDTYCTLIRDGELIDVCVTHDKNTIYFYYDGGDYELFETAELPTDELYDDANEWLISVYLDDVTGNSSSDLEVRISHPDMSESDIIWLWNEEKGFVYQPFYSYFYRNIVADDPPVFDFSVYEGIWFCDEDNMYDDIYIEIDLEGNWQLYSGGELADEGYLYIMEGDSVYVYSCDDGALNGGCVILEGSRLYIGTAGYFNYADGIED